MRIIIVPDAHVPAAELCPELRSEIISWTEQARASLQESLHDEQMRSMSCFPRPVRMSDAEISAAALNYVEKKREVPATLF